MSAQPRPRRYRRCDGLVFHPDELSTAIPVFSDELADLAAVLGRIEDWLLGADPDTIADLASYLLEASTMDAATLIDLLGRGGLRLHQLISTAGSGPTYRPA